MTSDTDSKWSVKIYHIRINFRAEKINALKLNQNFLRNQEVCENKSAQKIGNRYHEKVTLVKKNSQQLQMSGNVRNKRNIFKKNLFFFFFRSELVNRYIFIIFILLDLPTQEVWLYRVHQ